MARRSRAKRKSRRVLRGCTGGCGCLIGIVLFLAFLGSQIENVAPDRPPEQMQENFGDPIEIPLDEDLEGAAASMARNFYFIFDGSGSMKSEPGGACQGGAQSSTKLEGAQWAVEQFLEGVPEDVNLGLFLFDREGRREVVPLGNGNRDAFMGAIHNIQAGGGTPLGPALDFGTDRLVEQYKRQLGYGEYRLVVVTDGRADKIPEAARYAAHFGMPIYAIGLCVAEDHPLRQYAVSYRAADNFEDLARGLEETLAELPTFDVTEFEE